ncbi:GYD domain-containing protein [bacterium]|nr:GYD domain-containing protein [bacterium]
MPTYILLLHYTEQGIKNIKDSPSRLDGVRKLFQDHGAKLKDFFLVTGQYDAVSICEAPNDEAFAKLALTIAAKGNVRTETLRAFTEDEYRKIVAGL